METGVCFGILSSLKLVYFKTLNFSLQNFVRTSVSFLSNFFPVTVWRRWQT